MEYDGSVRISTIIDTTGIKTGVKEISKELGVIPELFGNAWEKVGGVIDGVLSKLESNAIESVTDKIMDALPSESVAGIALGGLKLIVDSIIGYFKRLEEEKVAAAYERVFGDISFSVDELQAKIGSFSTEKMESLLDITARIEEDLPKWKEAFDTSTESFGVIAEP